MCSHVLAKGKRDVGESAAQSEGSQTCTDSQAGRGGWVADGLRQKILDTTRC